MELERGNLSKTNHQNSIGHTEQSGLLGWGKYPDYQCKELYDMRGMYHAVYLFCCTLFLDASKHRIRRFLVAKSRCTV